MTIVEVRDWLNFLFEAGILFILIAEYHYDAAKDEKKQRRTKTIKKTTTNPDGSIVAEENIETTESKGDKNA